MKQLIPNTETYHNTLCAFFIRPVLPFASLPIPATRLTTKQASQAITVIDPDHPEAWTNLLRHLALRVVYIPTRVLFSEPLDAAKLRYLPLEVPTAEGPWVNKDTFWGMF
jgi:hypothetical protein